MATNYLSEAKLDRLAQRMAAVFSQKPIVAQFTLQSSAWEMDPVLPKYKASVFISQDFTENTMGSIGVDLSEIASVADRLEAANILGDCNIMAAEVINGSMIFYADDIPTIDIPFIVYMIGEMPTEPEEVEE